VHDRGATVVERTAAPDEPARLQRRDHLGGVGFRRAHPAAQRPQLELAPRGVQHDQDREAGRGQPLAIQLGRQASSHMRLGAHQGVQRAVRKEISRHQLSVGAHRRSR